MQVALDAGRELASCFRDYTDLAGRGARYFEGAQLPLEIQAWPTGVPGGRWTVPKILHAVALGFERRPGVPRDARAFDLRHTTQSCMLIRRSKVLQLPTGESLYLWLAKGYPRIRPLSDKLPGGTESYSVFRLLLHLAWGPQPQDGRRIACHFCCDLHGCCNPWHGRWGSPEENRQEAVLLTAWREAYLPLPPALRALVPHPAAAALQLQGLVPG